MVSDCPVLPSSQEWQERTPAPVQPVGGRQPRRPLGLVLRPAAASTSAASVQAGGEPGAGPSLPACPRCSPRSVPSRSFLFLLHSAQSGAGVGGPRNALPRDPRPFGVQRPRPGPGQAAHSAGTRALCSLCLDVASSVPRSPPAPSPPATQARTQTLPGAGSALDQPWWGLRDPLAPCPLRRRPAEGQESHMPLPLHPAPERRLLSHAPPVARPQLDLGAQPHPAWPRGFRAGQGPNSPQICCSHSGKSSGLKRGSQGAQR